MRTTVARVAALLVASGLLIESRIADSIAAPKPRLGVFGTINGKKFKATSRQGVDDPCVMGIYNPANGNIIFTALECRRKRRRQGAQKRNFKILVINCSKADPGLDTSTPPFELQCGASQYAENKTRFNIPVSTTQWGASVVFDSNFVPSSPLNMRVDAFDGTNVRGALFGAFDVSVMGAGSAVPAQIATEVQFDFPFDVR